MYQYPNSPQEAHTDSYFKTEIEDVFHWMEDPTDERIKAWITAQNSFCEAYLSQIPFREQLRKRYEQLFNYPKMYGLKQVGAFIFFAKNEGLQNQAVIYRQQGLDGQAEVFIDPNTYSGEGTVAINLLGASPSAEYIAYSVAKAGSDWSEIRVKEVASGRDLDDVIPWVKFSDASWDETGFFYTRYPKPEVGKEYAAETANSGIYYHQLGDKYDEDKLIYQNPEEPNRYHNVSLTADKAYLLLYIRSGTHGYEVHVKKMADEGWHFTPLFTGFDHKHIVLYHENDHFWVLTDWDAPNKQLVKIDLSRPEPEQWETIIAQQAGVVIEDAHIIQGKIMVSFLENATSHLNVCDMLGKLEKEISLPSLGSVFCAASKPSDTAQFFAFSSFVHPPTIYRYDFEKEDAKIFFQPQLAFDADMYIAEQKWFTSTDGEQVSIFLVHHKDVQLTQHNPTYLYGYGGFNISLTPSFSSSHLLFLEQGGVLAIANLRGGGEYGEAWHQAGMRLQKQQVFDDFIAAGEFLIQSGYCSPARLAIAGGSNGGLLVGACVNQRPDLFRVALPAVGVMDMLRYHKFTVGWGWVPEYGSSEESEEMFRNLLAYSPLHNIQSDREYPAVMVTTGDHDDRVVPAHSFKYIAQLQRLSTSKRVHLIRIDTNAGHGAGKPTDKIIAEVTDKWAFILYEMGIGEIK